MALASCRRLLSGVHPQQQRATAVRVLLQRICSQPQRPLITSSSLNKFNQPRLSEESDHVTDGVTHPPQVVVPRSSDSHTCTVQEPEPGNNSGSHDRAVVNPAVDGVYHELYPDPNVGQGEKGEEEEWVPTELTLKKLPSIYLKLSKSRLTGI